MHSYIFQLGSTKRQTLQDGKIWWQSSDDSSFVLDS